MTDIGSSLLGRRPSAPDDRDFPLELWLDGVAPLQAALAKLLTSSAALATKNWARIATPLILGQSPVPPAPAPAATSWADNEPVLDQGQTPHCVGFGGAQWGNTLPVDDKFSNADGDRIYYACKVVDGEPGAEDGSDVRSLAKVLQQEGRLSSYAFGSVPTAVQWLLTKGPVIFGTDWTNDMFTPDADGLVHPTGGVAGGHCYVGYGYDPATGRILCLNSWGSSWGANGRFSVLETEFTQLFASNGEALAAVELP
jgi:hypothetical protein